MKYSLIRLVLFAPLFALFVFLGVGTFLAVVFAGLIAFAISYLFFQKQRDAASAALQHRFSGKAKPMRSAGEVQDANAEDGEDDLHDDPRGFRNAPGQAAFSADHVHQAIHKDDEDCDGQSHTEEHAIKSIVRTRRGRWPGRLNLNSGLFEIFPYPFGDLCPPVCPVYAPAGRGADGRDLRRAHCLCHQLPVFPEAARCCRGGPAAPFLGEGQAAALGR